MRKIIYIILFLLITSCSAERGFLTADIPEYDNKEGYKSLYIVDTIHINNPVIFRTKNKYLFVMSRESFDTFDGNEAKLFDRADAFLFEEYYIPLKVPIYPHSDMNASSCHDYIVELSETKKGIVKIYAYERNPDFFLLLLIRGDYYNNAYTGSDGIPPLIKLKNNKFSYYKLVMPCCLKIPRPPAAAN